MAGNTFLFDDFEFDTSIVELRRTGVPVRANELVLRLLEVFLQRPGEVITRKEFGIRVWDDRAVSQSTLTVAIARLRKTLDSKRGRGDIVQTVYGRGYRFVRNVEVRAVPSPPSVSSDLIAREGWPFVGRERILEHLDGALTRACAGSGGLIALTGDIGSGKTRIAEMLARDAATAGIPVAWGYHRELEETPHLQAFAGLLRDLLTRSALVKSAIRDPRFEALVSELEPLLPELGCDANASARQSVETIFDASSKVRLFDAVTRALTLIAQYTCIVLILDDLHRADATSLELLCYLLPELVRTRILVVVTLSDERKALTSASLRQIFGHGNCTRIALHPLTQEEVAGYVIEQLGESARSACTSVFKASGGNPLFMALLVQPLRGATYSFDGKLELPRATLGALLSRVGVKEEVRELLSVAAIIGRSFSVSLLQATTGCDPRSLMAILDASLANDLITSAYDAQGELAFKHELVRAALYETVGPAELRSWHLRIADALDKLAAVGEHPSPAMAEHVGAAFPGGDLRKTVLRCIGAANAAAEANSFAESGRYLRCAQEAIALIETSSTRSGLRVTARKRPNESFSA